MNERLIAIDPAAAHELVVGLDRTGAALEDAADRTRLLVIRAQRGSGAPALLDDVGGWCRRTAVGLAERIDAITRLDGSGVLVRLGGEVRRLHLDARGVADLDGLVDALVAAGLVRTCVPPGDLAARHAALVSLSRPVLRTLARQAPQVVGHADGMPFWARDEANRVLLRREITRLDGRAGALEHELRGELSTLGIDRPVLQRSARLQRQLATVDGLRGDTWLQLSRRHRRLLETWALRRELVAWRDDEDLTLVKLDAHRGRVVLARGDLDGASHVATLIPGANTALDNVGRGYGGWMDRLHDATQARLDLAGAGEAATVLWLDLDTPDGLIPDAVHRGAADDASARLSSFLEGVGARDRELVTTFGHSYGSVVIGRSLAGHEGRLASDHLVALASPGLGVHGSAALGLHDDQRLFAATLEGDPISAVGRWNPVTGDLGRVVHGPDPRRLRAVETIDVPVHDLEGDVRGLGRGIERHMQYLDDGSLALGVFADLAAGRHRFAPTPPARAPTG